MTIKAAPTDIEKVIYLHDHGWDVVLPKNQEENRALHRYTKRDAFGMGNMTLP